MTKKRNAKHTFVASIVSMMLCLAMLISTSLAWFTDVASNTGNAIAIGELGVELRMWMDAAPEGGTYVNISDGDSADKKQIFSEALDGKWEPGKTKVAFLQVANVGDLALNYNIILDVLAKDADGNVVKGISEAMEYAIIPDADKAAYDVAMAALANPTEEGVAAVTGWNAVEALAKAAETAINEGVTDETAKTALVGNITEGSTLAAPNGALDEVAAGQEDSDYFVLAVHMKEDAGNAWQNKEITIDVTVNAKQMVSENDYFDNTYDANADYYKKPANSGLFTDGSAEDGGAAWTYGASKVSDAFAHGGTYAFRFADTGTGNESNIGQKLSLENGKTYKISGWIYGDYTSYSQFFLVGSAKVNLSGVPVNEWYNFTYTFTVGDGKHTATDLTQFPISFRVRAKDGNTYLDDLCIELVEGAATE